MRFSEVHLLHCTLYSLCGSFEISYAALFSSGFRLHSHGGSWSWISITEKPQSGFSPHKSCWAKLYAWNHLVVNSMAYLSHMRQLHCWGRARCWERERESRKQLGMPQESSLKTGRQLVPCLWAVSCGKGLGGGLWALTFYWEGA